MTRHFARVIAAGPVLVSEWNAGSLSDPAGFGPYQRIYTYIPYIHISTYIHL